jgi:hypothetical protein
MLRTSSGRTTVIRNFPVTAFFRLPYSVYSICTPQEFPPVRFILVAYHQLAIDSFGLESIGNWGHPISLAWLGWCYVILCDVMLFDSDVTWCEVMWRDVMWGWCYLMMWFWCNLSVKPHFGDRGFPLSQTSLSNALCPHSFSHHLVETFHTTISFRRRHDEITLSQTALSICLKGGGGGGGAPPPRPCWV